MSSRASNPQQSGPPTQEQLLQYLMLAKGMNRETAGQELTANSDQVEQEFQKMKKLVESAGQQSGSESGSSHSGFGSDKK